MGTGFLQGFYEAAILGEPSPHAAGLEGFRQALHLATLGLAPEAHAIITLLHSHGLRPGRQSDQDAAIHFFYHYNKDLPSPFADSPAADDVTALARSTMKFPASYLHGDGEDCNLENITEERYAALQRAAAKLRGQEHAHAATGHRALKLSAALAVLLHMASTLGKDADAQSLLEEMGARIHANTQAAFIHGVPAAWPWFLRGGLRRAMRLDEAALKTYAAFVRDTLESRLEDGPVLPGQLYKGWSVRQLLEEIDRNTFSDPEFNPKDFYFDGEAEASAPSTILKEPATEEAIRSKEDEMNRSLPAELRELFRISDGCHPVKTAPGNRATKFPPLEDVFLEDDEYMDDYGFTLLPDFSVEPRRPRGVDEREWGYGLGVGLCRSGGIAVYEHDGQGTEYVWVVPKETLDAARERVEEVRSKVSDEQKERIDAEIVNRYGSKEAYEGMQYCVYVQGFASPEGQRVHPDFMSYLRSVAFESRVSPDRSPVKQTGPE